MSPPQGHHGFAACVPHVPHSACRELQDNELLRSEREKDM